MNDERNSDNRKRCDRRLQKRNRMKEDSIGNRTSLRIRLRKISLKEARERVASGQITDKDRNLLEDHHIKVIRGII